MNCFTHRSSAAIGVCRVCGRALCEACARVSPLALLCSDECVAHQKKLDSIVEFSGRTVDYQRKTRAPLPALFLGALGIIAVGVGVAPALSGNRSVEWYAALSGVVFLTWAVLIFRAQRRITRA